MPTIVRNNGPAAQPLSSPQPKTITEKLETATKALGWTTVALLVASFVTLFLCPLISPLLFGLAICTATAAGGTFIASLVTKAKSFFENIERKIEPIFEEFKPKRI